MFSSKLTKLTIIAINITLLLCVSANPITPRSTTEHGTDSSRTESGSGSGSGREIDGPCDTDLSLNGRERETLISEIMKGLELMQAIDIQVWDRELLRATVDVYGGGNKTIFDPEVTNYTCSAHKHSDYGYAIANSVTYLQMFVRPVGDILTNETVREVIEHELGYSAQYSAARDHLSIVTKQVYQLVIGNRNIHGCIIPSPLMDDHTALHPQPPLSVSDPCYRDMVVDGVANELQKLAEDLRFALNCFYIVI